jgi:hypothetical protein
MPATQVDDHRIGNGAPCPVTLALGAAYNRKAQSS